MQIELWPVARVKPYANNPRVNDGAVDVVAASLKEFGWRQPQLLYRRAGVQSRLPAVHACEWKRRTIRAYFSASGAG
jgi:hypothetical protein